MAIGYDHQHFNWHSRLCCIIPVSSFFIFLVKTRKVGVCLWLNTLVFAMIMGGGIPVQIQFQVSALVSEESLPICQNLL